MRVLSLWSKTCPGHQLTQPHAGGKAGSKGVGDDGGCGGLGNLPRAAPLAAAMFDWSKQIPGASGAKASARSGERLSPSAFLSLSASGRAMPARILPGQKKRRIFTQSRGEGETRKGGRTRQVPLVAIQCWQQGRALPCAAPTPLHACSCPHPPHSTEPRGCSGRCPAVGEQPRGKLSSRG